MLALRSVLAAFSVSVACTALAHIAGAQGITLQFSHFLGPQSFFQRDVAEPWAKRLADKTSGKVKVEIHNSTSPKGDIFKQATQVKDGTVDIALGLRGAEGDRFPGTSVIELPFLVQDSLSGSKALWSIYGSGALAAEYKDYKVLALFVHDPGLIHTRDKRVVNLSDLKGLRLRAPNKVVAAAIEFAGATPVVLQVHQIIDAVKRGEIDGIVTNWANPLQDFNVYMKHHTDTKFYTSAFFVVMNKDKYASLPSDVRAAIDEISGDTWVAELGSLWNRWAEPVRKGAGEPGHVITVPDAATMAAWREGLRPVTDKYLDDLAKSAFPDARSTYRKLVEMAR